MATFAPAEGMPSPSKKVYAPAPVPAPADPTDIRGSLRVQTPYDDTLRARPAMSRAAVSHGHTTASFSRRPLGPAMTMPILSFAQPSVPSYAGEFKSGKALLDEAYAAVHGAPSTGKRADELRPMWETGSATDAGSARAASLRAGDSGFFGGPPQAPVAEDGDGDGFSLDEVWGPARGGLTGFAGFGAAAPAAGEDSQSTSHTVTQRMKRAYGEDASAAQAGGDDDEMAATDVEDEGDEDPAPFAMFKEPRRVAGRKAWGKTQSLPPSAFAGKMEF